MKMKTKFSKHALILAVLCGTAWALGPQAVAQTPPGLEIEMAAGQAHLTVTGQAGTTCQIQWTEDLSPTGRWSHLAHNVIGSSPSTIIDSTSASATRRYYRAVWTPGTNLVWISPGTFTMGSPTNEVDRWDDEGPQTVVTLTRGFWMGKYEVTQAEYLDVVGTNPSYHTGDLSRPVEQVTWFDATNYCGLLTQRERTAGRIPATSVYRLPTEAEWEYTCRGGTTTRFNYGDDPGYTNLTNYAWYSANSGNRLRPVGQKLPNGWGLYDMHGNVFEWCQSFWGSTLPGGTVVDPQGPATGSRRVIRSGYWGSSGRGSRSALRDNDYPDTKHFGVGFRVVLAP